MKIRVTNLVLLLGAFVIAGFGSWQGIAQYDGGDLSGVIGLGSVALFVITASLLCSLGLYRSQSAEWQTLSQTLGGEYSITEAGMHGTIKGMPVFARVESCQNNSEYLDQTCALYSSAKHFFVLTLSVPYKAHFPWRVVYRPKSETQLHGEWHVACEASRDLAQALEMAGVADLFSSWDMFTVVKCDAESGEMTLRYPAPQRYFCPTQEEFESQINLLRRTADIWQHATESRIAA